MSSGSNVQRGEAAVQMCGAGLQRMDLEEMQHFGEALCQEPEVNATQVFVIYFALLATMYYMHVQSDSSVLYFLSCGLKMV